MPAADQKKAVCTKLTGVLKKSPLGQAIDPKAFFMMLNTNYPVLCTGEQLDLNPLWDAMKGQHADVQLFGLFLRFEEAGRSLSLRVTLPSPVAALTSSERSTYLEQFMLNEATDDLQSPARPVSSAGRAIPAPLPRDESSSNGRGISPIDLADVPSLMDFVPDLTPTPLPETAFAGLDDEAKRRLVTNIVGILKSTDAGPSLRSAELSFVISSRFSTLCDGVNFFLPPLAEALREMPGVTEEHLYVAAVRLRVWLARMGMALVEPAWTLDAATKERLEAEARRVTAKPAPLVIESPKGPPKEREKSQHYAVENKKTSKYLRYALYTLVLAAGLAVALSTSPVKDLDRGPYAAAMPLIEAQLLNGAFVGTLDFDAWLKLDREKRAHAVEALEAVLKKENRLRGARVIHPRTHSVVMFDLKGQKLKAADSILGEGLAAE
jgi:hypothetical protein